MIKFIKSEKFILPIIYIMIGIIIYTLIKMLIGKIAKNKYIDKKKITIISLIKNIIKYLIFVLVILAILSVYGVDTTGIIASLGIAGIVIGLALQDVASDFLSGIFILFDNQYKIGDTVLINNFKGEVVSFGLMSTKIKSATGEVLIISNSSFKEVVNYSLNDCSLYIDIDVAYDTNIDKLEKVLENMKDEVEKIDGVSGNYKMLGINKFADSSIKYLITFDCKSGSQFQAKRDFNKILYKELNKAKIEIPYNKIDVNVRGKNE